MSGNERFDRGAALERLGREQFDVLVIGGGITGAGVAVDAAARGLRTALVEAEDFASGTSSASSKLVHGGLRYLEQYEAGLVFQNLAERQTLLRNAPHLVQPIVCVLPVFGGGSIADHAKARTYSAGLWMYDLFGGLRIGHVHRRASAQEVRSHLPTVRSDRLVAGFIYYDARADDARLTLDLVRTAADHGAAVANHASVAELRKDNANRVCGALIQPQGGPEGGVEIRARAVVSATGVWADEIADLDKKQDHVMRPAKGIHVVVPRTELPCDAVVIIPSPSDRRSVFAIPWGDKTYIGTTDTAYEGPLRGSTVDQADVAYLLDAVNAVVTHPVTEGVITGTWSGLRPLLAPKPGRRQSERTADLSRRHKVLVSRSGLITITGGKLTTYRKMAADTVDVLVRRLGVGARHGWTEHLPVHGSVGLADLRRPDAARRFGVAEAAFAHLLSRYGDDVPAVLAVVGERPEFAEPLADGQPFLAGEVIYAVRCEMATTVEDLLSRRMRMLPFDAKAASAAAARAAELAAGELGWDRERTAAEVKEFRELAAASLSAVAAGKEGEQQ